MPSNRRRARRLLAAVAVAAAMATAAQAQTAKRPSKQYTIEQFMATTAVTGASFSADEKRILFSSNQSGIYNVYSVPVAGGEPAAITHSTTDNTTAVSYFPADDRILFTRDQGGNELNHLYVRETDGREKDLTPGEKLKASFAGWTPAGDAFYVLSNERDARFFDVYRYDSNSYARTVFYKDETGYQLGAISDDGKWAAFAKPKTTSDSDIYLWNAATRETKLISAHEGEADYSPEDFDAGSRFLYYTTNDGGEFARVRRYDLAAGKHEEVEKADWDVSFTRFSHRGTYRDRKSVV